MYPLLEIKTVPIEIQVRTKSASIEYSSGSVEMEISRDNNGAYSITSRPIKLQMDSFQGGSPRNTAHSAAKAAQSDGQGFYQATSTYARQGQLTLNAKLSQFSPSAEDMERMEYSRGGAGVQSVPDMAAGSDGEEADMQILYSMDKLNIDWKFDNGEFKFTPGDIEISVKQRPDVVIKYTGGPIYVPRSSDPNYKPVNVEA